MTNKEYVTFAFSVALLGTLLGTALYYFIPDFWDPAPYWSIPISFVAALLTCIPVILFSRKNSVSSRVGFCLSLIVVGFCLVMLIQDSSWVGPAILPAGLLNNLQITTHWAYPLYVLIPGSLTVLASWAIGQIILAWFDRRSGEEDRQSLKTNARFLGSAFITASLGIFILGCILFIKSGPFYITLSFDHSFPEQLRESTIQELTANQLGDPELFDSVTRSSAWADTDDDRFVNILDNIVLLQIEPKGFRQWGKFRRSLALRLAPLESTVIGLDLHEDPTEPPVPLMPVYTFHELEFVFKHELLEALEIDVERFSAAIAQKLKWTDGASIQDFLNSMYVLENGAQLPIGELVSLQETETEVEFPQGIIAHWVQETSGSSPLATPTIDGALVYLDETRLQMFGISASQVDEIVRSYLSSNPTLTAREAVEALANIVVIEDGTGAVVRLGDVAHIEGTRVTSPPEPDVPQPHLPYEIRVQY